MGTSAGTNVFIHFGWRASALMTFGFSIWQIVLLLLRGPGLDPPGPVRGKRWIGWDGLRWELKKEKKGPAVREDAKSGDGSAQKDLEKGFRASRVNNDGKLQGDHMNEEGSMNEKGSL
jgi:hypothetical protein